MKNIQEVVLRIHTEIMHQKGINQKSTPDMEIRPKNGITSESIVIFILDLEEELDLVFRADDAGAHLTAGVFGAHGREQGNAHEVFVPVDIIRAFHRRKPPSGVLFWGLGRPRPPAT